MLEIGITIWFIIISVILVNLIGWFSLIFLALFFIFIYIELKNRKNKTP